MRPRVLWERALHATEVGTAVCPPFARGRLRGKLLQGEGAVVVGACLARDGRRQPAWFCPPCGRGRLRGKLLQGTLLRGFSQTGNLWQQFI